MSALTTRTGTDGGDGLPERSRARSVYSYVVPVAGGVPVCGAPVRVVAFRRLQVPVLPVRR
ncbi:hypothetical protein ACWDNT_18000 [Streptomyces sp. NPDC000963]|uniref:hypothetical protein n=1 Tax=Streptomyces sp. NPDC088752 TaxID=3154963 RepID=UPI00343F0A46